MVQWLRLHAFIAGSTSSIHGQGTKVPHAALWWPKSKIKFKKWSLIKKQAIKTYIALQEILSDCTV